MAENENTITVVGRIGKEPELRVTPQGADVLNFDVATTERKRGADGTWVDGATSWFRVAAWGGLARNAHGSLHRGQRVIVHGVLRVDEYQLDGGARSRNVELRATALGHDLHWGTSTFADAGRRTIQQPAPPVGQQPSQEAVRGWATSEETSAVARETVPAGPPSDWDTSLGRDVDVPF